jgi:3-phenylpropionate/trans-cinnamate dioxygenase ferredoxin subunit
MSEWVKVGSAGEVEEGEILSFSVGARQVAVANVEGDLHGLDDWCSHQQCSLAEGDLDGTIVGVRAITSQFDVITGEAVQVRHRSSTCSRCGKKTALEVLMTQE